MKGIMNYKKGILYSLVAIMLGGTSYSMERTIRPLKELTWPVVKNKFVKGMAERFIEEDTKLSLRKLIG